MACLIYYIFVFLFGACLGSFINVVVYRTRKNISVVYRRSFCPKCKKAVRWHDNIPILGYLFLGGKCRFCKKKISPQYPLVEALTGALFLASFVLHASSPETAVGYIIRDWTAIFFLLVIFLYDLKWYLILDRFSITFLAAAVLINLFLGMNPLSLFLGIVVGGGFFGLQYIASKGRWIGDGDIRLGAAMGGLLGLQGVLLALFLAYALGGFIAAGLLLFGKKKWGSKVPFGAFLAPAALIALFFQDWIISWYFSFF